MRAFVPPIGRANIHEPLTADPERPEDIFQSDILDRSRLAERILKRLAEADCPSAIGIYGGWGTGKTSLLNLMKQLNEHQAGGVPSPLCLVSIDAWEHESSEGLLIPVVVALDEIGGSSLRAKEIGVMVKRALFASGVVVADAILKKYTNVELSQLQNAIADAGEHDAATHKAILRKWRNDSREIQETKKAFTSLVESARRRTGREKIVVCIDNLDRCSPENVVRLLESVKVFFNAPGCVWVFAVDAEVIASYVNHKYEGTKMDGNSYLDKIIPEQYHLSLSAGLDREKIVNLLRYAAQRQALVLDERNIPQLPRVLVPRRLIKSAAKLAELKRQGGADGLNVSDAMLFNLALLYHVWPDFYQRFSSASNEHVRGILDHFFPAPAPSISQSAVSDFNALPLLKDYIEDQDLLYFLKTVFGGYPKSKDSFAHELINGIRGLRKVGLP